MAAPSQTKLASFELFGLLFGLSACILMKIHNSQPKPYMDELFHYGQTVKYCEGKFSEWDSMITTLPGLYTITVAAMNFISLIFGYEMKVICDLFWMRFVNLLFCMGNVILIHLLMNKMHQTEEKNEESPEKWRLIFSTFTIAIFPPLYFFTFLYYTDAGSVFFVLLLYYASLTGYKKSSALSGLVAIFFRQSNIVWVVFVAGDNLANILIERVKPEKKDLTIEDTRTLKFLNIVLKTVLSDFGNFTRMRNLLTSVSSTCSSYILVGISFAAFVIWNDGIVVGDRTAHRACLHFPQLFYFFAFTASFTFMYHITLPKIVRFLKGCLEHWTTLMFAAVIVFLSVYFFTYEHPYLLADNRHYTFYIWSRIFKRHEIFKFALIPGYVYAAFSVFDSLSHKNILWKMVFVICLISSTVPQRLLEFRYFIIPFLLFRLNMRIGSVFQVLLEVCLYIAVNSFTIYYFIEKTFSWPSVSGPQRFMW